MTSRSKLRPRTFATGALACGTIALALGCSGGHDAVGEKAASSEESLLTYALSAGT